MKKKYYRPMTPEEQQAHWDKQERDEQINDHVDSYEAETDD